MRRGALFGLLIVTACGGGGSSTPPAGEQVFDLDVLHEIDIRVDVSHLDALENDRENRVPCMFTFDGTTLGNVGIRQKGGIGSISNLSGKPGFSVKFDELVMDQELDGLDKILLNNAIQDPTFIHEHIGYELYRAAGIPASRTSHAVVSMNGYTYGIYVIAEAVDKDFLREHFDGLDEGNLYEGPCCADFVNDPDYVELKDVEEGRTRDDLYALAAAIRDTPDDQFVAVVGELMDLDVFITGYAIDALTDHWDGYSFNVNNYYMYNDPADGRFVFMPHGMDQLFQSAGRDPFGDPVGTLSWRVRSIPELDQQYREKVATLMDTVWDVPAMHARIDRVDATLHTTTRTDERTAGDLASFDTYRDFEKNKIAARKEQLAP